MPDALFVLGIDPGTNRCGVALAFIPLQGEGTLLEARCLHGKSIDVDQRVQQIAGHIADVVDHAHHNAFGPIDLTIAYEKPYSRTGQSGRGFAGLEEVWKLIGAAIATDATRNLPTIAVSTTAVAAQFGATRMGRDQKKIVAVEWAQRRFGLNLGERDHDAAEAIAVAFAAGQVWRERRRLQIAEARQPRLTGPRGGKL